MKGGVKQKQHGDGHAPGSTPSKVFGAGDGNKGAIRKGLGDISNGTRRAFGDITNHKGGMKGTGVTPAAIKTKSKPVRTVAKLLHTIGIEPEYTSTPSGPDKEFADPLEGELDLYFATMLGNRVEKKRTRLPSSFDLILPIDELPADAEPTTEVNGSDEFFTAMMETLDIASFASDSLPVAGGGDVLGGVEI